MPRSRDTETKLLYRGGVGGSSGGAEGGGGEWRGVGALKVGGSHK